MAKKKPASKLQWSKRPTVSQDPNLGRKRRWIGRGLCKYVVTQYPDYSGEYIAAACTLAGESLLGTKRTLAAAQKLCEADAKTNARGT